MGDGVSHGGAPDADEGTLGGVASPGASPTFPTLGVTLEFLARLDGGGAANLSLRLIQRCFTAVCSASIWNMAVDDGRE